MATRKRFLRLQSLVSFLQSEKNGDEVFLKFNGKKIAPKKEKYYEMTNDPLPLNIEMEVPATGKWVELELWEYDPFLPNTRLGHFKLFVDDQHSDTFTAELSREKDSTAKYVLNWELVSKLV